MPTNWKLLGVLPNVSISQSVEAEYLAIVPASDDRLTALSNSSTATEALLNRFTDEFGKTIKPTAVLLRSDQDRVNIEALISLRNIFAISAIVNAWCSWVKYPGGLGVGTHWADYFDIYAWSPGKNGSLVAYGPELTASLQEPDSFKGQNAPGLEGGFLVQPNPDIHLLEHLRRHWRRHFIRKRPSRETQRLFRSLEVAYAAARVPFESDYRFHIVGLRIALWVGAVEALLNPKTNGAVEVAKQLKSVQWIQPELCQCRYFLVGRKWKTNRSFCRVGLVPHLYSRLYQLRNDFLHGNRVGSSRLKAPGGANHLLFSVAPLLYRQILMVNLKQYAPRAREKSYFSHDNFEEALLAVTNRKQKQ